MATYYRSDGWVKSVLGQAIAGASIYICTQPADTAYVPPAPLAQIYADPAGLTPITQPILTDGFGHYDYYAATGTAYTEVVVNGARIQAVYQDQIPMGATLGGGGGGAVSSVFGRTGDVLATSGDYSVSQITGAAPLASPSFTGTIQIVNAYITGTLKDGGASVGTPGQVLSSTGVGTSWITPSASSSDFVKINSVVVGTPVANVTFSGIPSTYKNLKLVITARYSAPATDFYMQFNGDSGANYQSALSFAGSTNGQSAAFSQSLAAIGSAATSTAPANQAGVAEVVVFDYAGTVFYKSATGFSHRLDSASVAYIIMYGLTWNSTAAINAIELIAGAGNFVTGSTFTLYGIT